METYFENKDLINRINEISDKRDYITIRYCGCYGDPMEYGYETVYVYNINYKGWNFQLDTNSNLNELIELLNFDRVIIRRYENEITGNE